jgi:hypothetical protein
VDGSIECTLNFSLSAASKIKMQCLLIGVASSSSELDEKLRSLITTEVTRAEDFEVTWIDSSYATDEENGQRTLLLSAIILSDASNGCLNAVSAVVGDDISCELWATAPAILPLRPADGYGKYIKYNKKEVEKQGLSQESWASLTMKEYGIFFQSEFLDENTVEEIRVEIMSEIKETEDLIRMHHPLINIGKDFISFREIASRGNERFDLLLQTSSSSSSSSKIREIINTQVLERILPMAKIILGETSGGLDFDLSVVYSKPGAPDQGWHADGEHQKGAADIGWNINGWKTHLADPYALCLFIPLIDLDDETGFTQFWPASHQSRGLLGFGPVAKLTESTWDAKAKAGSLICYDYRTMHRGMKNCSTIIRPVVQILIKKKWYEETRNYGTVGITEVVKHRDDMPECGGENAPGAA